jgi:hypothetical protein
MRGARFAESDQDFASERLDCRTYGSYRRTLVNAAIEAASGEGLADDPLDWFAA